MIGKAQAVFLIVCIFLSAGMGSCKKKDNLDTPYTRMAGKWKKVRYATDDNANGTIDAWEVHDMRDGITNILELKKDSSGVESTTYTPDLFFDWIITGEQSLVLIYNTGDTFTYKIPVVNSGNLHLTTKSKIGLAAYYYEKQR